MQQREEIELLRWRISLVGYLVVAAVAILVFGFWNHQIVQTGYYDQRAEQNRVREIPLVAPRGRIYDRYNRILADNRPSYNIVLIRENSPHTVEQTAAMLSPGVDVPVDEFLNRINRRRREPKFRPIILKEDVSVGDIAFVKAHRYELPEISVEYQPRRRYLGGNLAAHALGYVGEVTEAELGTEEFKDFKPGDQVGRTGLERQYNAVLHGKDGFRRVVVNSFGREMDRLQEEAYTPGNDLYTTIDLDLQRAAEEMIGDNTGAAVAIDPRTGEVLAMVSKPAFDPNLFATRISGSEWTTLINDPRKPLQNRVIQNHYSPGSVFKIFMAAAGLESEVLHPLDSFYCPGHGTFYGHTFACWKAGGHGTIGLHSAIVDSCNVFFYNVGKNLGIGNIARYATTMGLGRKSGIDLPNEDPGIIPSEEWKRRVFKTAWYQGETISVSIGQGAVSVTPMQITWAMGGLASGGRLVQPHLVKPELVDKFGMARQLKTEEYPLHQSTVDAIGRAMWGVVNEAGTGTKARVEGFDVAGKTGTAQVVGKQSYGTREEFNDHAWFVGFAPYRNPEIAVGVFMENGGHGGTVSAPVAQAIMNVYYKKKTGKFGESLITNLTSLKP